MTSTPIIDSLPYFDTDIDDPALKVKVDDEIARELKRTPTVELHKDVPPAVELFKTNELLAAELERVASNLPLTALDTTRYGLPAPSELSASVEDWQTALNNAHSQAMHQNARQANISLLQTYGSNAWKVSNYLLEADVIAAEKELEKLQDTVTEVNRERKNQQLQAGKTLTSLENRWKELVSNVLQIELANVALETEVESLRMQELSLESS